MADDIAERIRRGGSTRPERSCRPRELAEPYVVSLSTAQRVQLILKERGLIVGRQGDGVYVAEGR
jgi:DNA-binding GntR family transcriptional regulator